MGNITFNIFKAIRYLADNYSCFSIDVIDDLVQEIFEIDGEDELKVVVQQCFTQAKL